MEPFVNQYPLVNQYPPLKHTSTHFLTKYIHQMCEIWIYGFQKVKAFFKILQMTDQQKYIMFDMIESQR